MKNLSLPKCLSAIALPVFALVASSCAPYLSSGYGYSSPRVASSVSLGGYGGYGSYGLYPSYLPSYGTSYLNRYYSTYRIYHPRDPRVRTNSSIYYRDYHRKYGAYHQSDPRFRSHASSLSRHQYWQSYHSKNGRYHSSDPRHAAHASDRRQSNYSRPRSSSVLSRGQVSDADVRRQSRADRSGNIQTVSTQQRQQELLRRQQQLRSQRQSEEESSQARVLRDREGWQQRVQRAGTQRTQRVEQAAQSTQSSSSSRPQQSRSFFDRMKRSNQYSQRDRAATQQRSVSRRSYRTD